jgi:hypothetical protein
MASKASIRRKLQASVSQQHQQQQQVERQDQQQKKSQSYWFKPKSSI